MLPIKQHLASLNRVKNPAQTRAGCLRLDKNESALELPQEIVDKFKAAITPELLTIYPELDPLTDKLAAWLGCTRQNIYLASGSDPAIKALFELFVAPGDTVLLPAPTYQMMVVYCRMFQAKLVEAHFKPGLELKIEEVIALMKEHKPKLVCLANPNSPTGTAFSRADILKIVEAAAAQNTVILIDEAYFHFHPETVVDVIGKYPNLAISRTFSKAVGLAAVRLGFIAAHEEMIQGLNKVRPMYEANGLAAKFSEIMLDNMDVVEKNVKAMREGKKVLVEALDGMGLKHYPSYSNFVVVEAGSPERGRQIIKLLREKKILISGDIAHPSMSSCIRIGVGSPAQMKRFLEAFREVWAGLQAPSAA
jgi:histidinol-phosphate aminotransferase